MVLDDKNKYYIFIVTKQQQMDILYNNCKNADKLNWSFLFQSAFFPLVLSSIVKLKTDLI